MISKTVTASLKVNCDLKTNTSVTEVVKYFKFVIGGGLSLLLSLAITFILTEFLYLHYLVSLAIALLIEIFFLFLYHSVITFSKKGRFWLFMVIVLFISDLNWILVYVCSIVLGWNYLASMIVVAAVLSLINFSMNRWLVF